MCVYTKKVCMCGGCFDKYISAEAQKPPPPQKTKISGYTIAYHNGAKVVAL